MNKLDRYAVRMRFRPVIGESITMKHAYLSVRGRTEWTKRTASKHAADCRAKSVFTDHYDEIIVERI